MLLQIEKECLDVYKRKVEQAAKARAQLLQALSDSKLELSSLSSALGEKSFLDIVSSELNFFWCIWLFCMDYVNLVADGYFWLNYAAGEGVRDY